MTLPDAEQDWEISFAAAKPGPPKSEVDAEKRRTILVPDALPSRVHVLVQEAKAALRERKLTLDGRVLMPKCGLGILVAPASTKRALLIMDTLLKACEAQGWSTGGTPEYRPHTIVRVQGCEVHIRLEEGLRQSPRTLSEWEKKWETERSRPRKRPPYELVPNGKLKLFAYGTGFHHTAEWRDGLRRRLEDMLDSILAHIAAAPEAKRQGDRAQAAFEARQREEERRQLAQEEAERERLRIRRAEQARVDKLVADAEAWEQARIVRAYIEAWVAKTEAGTGLKIGGGSEYEQWVTWARAQADRLDPLIRDVAINR